MKKRVIFGLCAVFVILAMLSPSLAIFAGASQSEELSREEQLKRESYTFLYFYNLTYYYPHNVVGTCGYVAMAMLLAYYDCYWDDNLVPDAYMTSANWATNSIPDENCDSEYTIYRSPGDFDTIPKNTRNDIRDEWSALSKSDPNYEYEKNRLWQEYQGYLADQDYDTLHYLLIHLLADKNTIGENENMNTEKIRGRLGEELQEELIADYLNHVGQSSNWQYELVDDFRYTYADPFISSYDPSYTVPNSTNHDYLRYKIIEYVNAGIPVYATINYNKEGEEEKTSHCVIVYDYDATEDILYVHSGWHGTQNNYHHKDVTTFGVDGQVYFRSYMVLQPIGEHIHSSNYYFDDKPNGTCSCSFPNHQHEEYEGEYTYVPISETHHEAEVCWCHEMITSPHRFKAQGLNKAICIDCGFVKIVGFDTPIVNPLDIDLPPTHSDNSTKEEKQE